MYHQHEKVSSELAAVRGELEKALADLQVEAQNFTLHRREINNVLIQLSTEAHRDWGYPYQCPWLIPWVYLYE